MGVLHFCGLGYSRTNGQTCDNFIDIEKLRYEPEFQRYMADAFAPVGLMIDEWRSQLPAWTPRLPRPFWPSSARTSRTGSRT